MNKAKLKTFTILEVILNWGFVFLIIIVFQSDIWPELKQESVNKAAANNFQDKQLSIPQDNIKIEGLTELTSINAEI